MGKAKAPETVTLEPQKRIRFADGSGVCVPCKTVTEAQKIGKTLGKGAVVAVENSETDEVLWEAKGGEHDRDGDE